MWDEIDKIVNEALMKQRKNYRELCLIYFIVGIAIGAILEYIF